MVAVCRNATPLPGNLRCAAVYKVLTYLVLKRDFCNQESYNYCEDCGAIPEAIQKQLTVRNTEQSCQNRH